MKNNEEIPKKGLGLKTCPECRFRSNTFFYTLGETVFRCYMCQAVMGSVLDMLLEHLTFKEEKKDVNVPKK